MTVVSISNCFWVISKNGIFDLWPWTKVKGHFTKWNPICDFLYVYNTKRSLSLNAFEIFAKIKFLTYDLWPWTKVKFHCTKWKHICNFLYVYNTNVVSISNCFRYICKNKIFDLWPLTFDQGQRSFHHMKAFMWFSISLQHKCSLYLSLIPIYLWK